MNKVWFDEAWEDYLYWQMQDRKTLKRINALLRDIESFYGSYIYTAMVSMIVYFYQCTHE